MGGWILSPLVTIGDYTIRATKKKLKQRAGTQGKNRESFTIILLAAASDKGHVCFAEAREALYLLLGYGAEFEWWNNQKGPDGGEKYDNYEAFFKAWTDRVKSRMMSI